MGEELSFKTEFKAVIGARQGNFNHGYLSGCPCDVAKPDGLLRGWT